MSVFKAREWWGTRTGDGEETDGAQLAVGNVDNAKDGVQKVVVGSLTGTLRIYRPSAKDFRPSDLVLEVALGGPILGVDIGAVWVGVDHRRVPRRPPPAPACRLSCHEHHSAF